MTITFGKKTPEIRTLQLFFLNELNFTRRNVSNCNHSNQNKIKSRSMKNAVTRTLLKKLISVLPNRH